MKTLEILTKIGERLEEITIANGYATDLGEKVEYFRDLESEYDNSILTFRDADTEVFSPKNSFHEAVMPVEIEAIIFGENVLDLGCLAIADILLAVAVDPTWDGKAIDTSLKERFKSVETKGKKAVRVGVTIEVIYRFPRWRV